MQQTENYINAMADYFDQSVATSSDDQLFAAGYLRGHIDLAVGTLQLQEQAFSVDTLQQQVAQSLQQAISAGELNDADQALVVDIWQHLQQLPC
ncbi:YfcL family protein [Rheinheimera riviphila]|uniref:YfcL family protein n=1 Tax=Rheinheimera riviphila TaxID=1834037 RepID=A0A437QT24_9GAMM|nr:YfcL family protein [Rheinheimera riviphila]RVU37652.1 YfcL family protein [Rheinheimera riviphila]